MDQQKIDASLAASALPTLPYAIDALAPVISAQTVDFHYNKHHKAYVDKLNQLIIGTPFEGLTVPEIMQNSFGDTNAVSIFNNAAQIWNHTFYWYSLKPHGGGAPVGALKDKIEATFGSVDNLKKEWANLALNTFGSGWAWLVLDGDTLKIMKTENANSPIVHTLKPLLTIDVWEHAYYLDHQNRRADYVNAVLDQLINWDFATHNYLQATTAAIA
jgi:Fe-Mn family superoxide dismutase